jgi:hypothetical protein
VVAHRIALLHSMIDEIPQQKREKGGKMTGATTSKKRKENKVK